MIKPLYDNVLLKKEKASNETKSGLILSQKEKNEDYAVVAAVSECKEVKIHDHVYEMPLKVGDKVMYKKYSGTEIKDNDEEFILINAQDILAVVE
ncbi:MAG: co-chaperone GroES [Erysipelotrichaceae bacterium]|nr:co-chaperone GroES [Erysipelotrichaceae bacterium]